MHHYVSVLNLICDEIDKYVRHQCIHINNLLLIIIIKPISIAPWCPRIQRR